MELKSLPDVAKELQSPVAKFSSLSWVGMEEIQLPLLVSGATLSAHVTAQVNLLAQTSRGIHMSRLYQILHQDLAVKEFSWSRLQEVAEKFVDSQGGISSHAKLKVRLNWPLKRRALKSSLEGWRLYPVEFEMSGSRSDFQRTLKFEVLYSSTCPASTALSLEVWKETHQNQNQASGDWIEALKSMPATPHAQRSRAQIEIQLKSTCQSVPSEWIEKAEETLSTPVQTIVKRVDEQEFAKRNGENTMFCEDAARRIQSWLESESDVLGYWGRFEHQESLHPHNAVAVIEKTVKL